MRRLLVIPALALGLSACIDGGEDPGALGMAVEPGPHGPAIMFNPLIQPIPDVPFPNDLSLRITDETASGVGWNVALDQASDHRSHLRERVNQLDGFGPYAPITVSFEGPIDLSTVTDDSVILINIEPGHPREGERVPLDLGKGFFPITADIDELYGQDPNVGLGDFLFGEDNTGEDGTRVTYYEHATNTLIIRPIVPLAQKARHAVLLTRDIQGEATDGTFGSIRAPFDFKAHAAQTPLVRAAAQSADLPLHKLAYGWTYTTADMLGPLLTMRDGLYGEGPLKWLGDVARPGLLRVHHSGVSHDAEDTDTPDDPTDTPYILQAEFFARLLNLVGLFSDEVQFDLDIKALDYVVFGSIETPNLRGNTDRIIDIDPVSGAGEAEPQVVPLMITVPKQTDRYKAPFPVLFYFHGTGSTRMEALVMAEAMAKQGWATMSFDAVGHGPLVPNIVTLINENIEEIGPLLASFPRIIGNLLVPDRVEEFAAYAVTNPDGTPNPEGINDFARALDGIGLWAEIAVFGRNEDIDGDGELATAESFFSADPFRQCSSFWQDTVDLMQIVKQVRGFDPNNMPAAIANPRDLDDSVYMPNLLAGDFNADGVLDLGGPDVAMGVAGTSLGGFHSVIAAAVEPEITTASPIVAGGGFTDLMLRSSLREIVTRIMMEVFGVLVIGCPDVENQTLYLSLNSDSRRCGRLEEGNPFATLALPAPGTPIRLKNLRNGLVVEGEINANGGLSIAVESDKGDVLEITIGEQTFEVAAPIDGSGYTRNTPDFRRVLAVQQHVFDRCDPINFIRAATLDPPRDFPTTNVLMINAIGDDTVPFSTNVNLALAGGLLGKTPSKWMRNAKRILRTNVMQNGHYDLDDVAGDNPPDEPAIGPFPGVETATGTSGVRFYGVQGSHAFIAFYEQDGFEYGRYAQNQAAIYHACGGRLIYDDPCLSQVGCEVLDNVQDLPGCAPPK